MFLAHCGRAFLLCQRAQCWCMCVDGAQSVLEVSAATGESKVTRNVTWGARAMLAVRRRAV